jgi:iron complex outermembrane receptor protein
MKEKSIDLRQVPTSMKRVLFAFFFFSAWATPQLSADPVQGEEVILNEQSLQNKQTAVSGVVTDQSGEPLIGVSVKVKGATIGTATDIDGKFSLNVPSSSSVLELSYVGFAKEEVLVGSKTSFNIVMKDDSKMLDQVVVTALGLKRSEKSLGYAMTEVKGDDLNGNLINPVSALQGKVAGLEISGSDGGLFGSAKVQIRGASTLGKNNQPIYVVDGIILDNSIKEGNPDWDSSPNDYGNELKNLNPADFETVSVLKGAAATALYGSRGLNGAIVITTKSGKSGQGLGINFSQTFGIDAVTKSPKLQNKFGPSYLAGYVNYGEKDANGNYYAFDTYGQFYENEGRHTLIGDHGFSYGPAFDGSDIEYYDGTTRGYSPRKSNFRDAYNLGFNSTTNVAVSGGNDKTTFYSSLSYKYASGTLPNVEFQRISFLGKASHKITDRVRLDVSMSLANSTPKNPQINVGENFVNGNWSRVYDPSYGKTRYRGLHGGLASNSYGDQYGNMPGKDIWWRLYENTYEQKETVVRPVVKLEVDLLDWLKFNTEGSYNYYYTRYEGKELGQGFANEGENNESGGKYEMRLTTKEQTNFNANFVLNKNFGDWTATGFLRGEYYESFVQSQEMKTKDGLVIPGQYFIGNSKKTPEYSAKISDRKRMLSLAFQAGVSWKDQVFVDVTGRNDWSSALVYSDGHGNSSYFYPSINGSWLITSTFRDQLPSWVSFAKVRGSWAQVGNDTDPYRVNSAYKLTTSTSRFGSNYYGLELPELISAGNLKPERKNAWEVGLDWRFLDNRIGVDFTYYKENTKDQIMTIAVPYQSGIKRQIVNAGNIQNRGIELAINATPIRTKDIEWDLNFTYTKNDNKIISLHENVADYIVLSGDPAYGNYRIGSVAKVGSSYGMLMSDSKVKIDKESGLPVLGWMDSSRTAYQSRNMSEISEIGSMVPDFLGGVSTTFRYKDWSLFVGLDMRFGGYVASYNSRYGTAYGFTKNSLSGAPGHGGVTWTSAYDGKTYSDGVIPNGIISAGTKITQPDGSVYTVSKGGTSSAGESYKELVDKGVIEPTHASGWNYRNNQWTNEAYDRGVVSSDWVKKLNYIALRDVSVSYRVPTSFCNKMKAKNMNLILAGHNLGYLLNSMPSGENPESVAGTAAGEFRVRSYQGVTSSFTFTVNVGF